MKCILISIGIIFLSSPLLGQNDCGCEKVLQQDFLNIEWDSETTLHYLNVLDEEIEKSSSVSSKVKGINGLDLGFNTDKSSKRDYFKRNEFDFSKSESLSILSRKTPEAAFNSYDNCIKACLGDAGIHLFLEKQTIDYALIRLVYRPHRGENEEIGISKAQVLVGKQIIDLSQDIPKILKPGWEKLIRIARPKNISMEVVVEADQFSNNLNIPPFSYYTTVRLTENEDCKDCTFVYLCSATGDSDVGRGFEMGPLKSSPINNNITFGPWENLECGKSAKGWHLRWGSCGTGKGTHFKGCQWVMAIRKITP